MASPTPEQREEFARLVRDDGIDPREALNRVMGKPDSNATGPDAEWHMSRPMHQKEVFADVGAGEAFGRGTAQGATLGFGDEAQGIIQAVGDRVMGYGQEPAAGHETLGEGYSRERDSVRIENARVQRARGGAYLAGDLAGSIITTPLLGSAKKLKEVAGIGLKLGAVGGLGRSNADLTKGDGTGDNLDQASGDILYGAAAGLAGGVVGYGLAKAAGAGGAWLLDKIGMRSRVPDAARAAAEAIAKDINRPSAIGPGTATVGQTLDKTRKLVAEWAADGHDLHLTPAQASGSRSQGLRELRLRNNPATMDEAQALERQQLETAAKMSDMYIRRIAKNPEILGDERAATGAATAVSNYGSKLLSTMRAEAKPIYQAAVVAGGGVDAGPTLARFESVIQKYNLKPNEMTGLINSLYSKLQKTGAGGGMALEELNNTRSTLLAVMRGKESLLGTAVPRTTEQEIAASLLEPIEEAFVKAESTSSGPAALLWRKGNKIWADGMKRYEDEMTDTVMTLLKRNAGDSAESIPARLIASEPSQIRAVMKVLEAESPADAANLRAQAFEEKMVQHGKPTPMSKISGEEGIDRLQPGGVLGMLSAKGSGQQFQALFAGDKTAEFGMRRMIQMFQRVGFGPNIKGSTTQPQLADAFNELGGSILDRMAAGNGNTAAAIQLIRKHLEYITGNAKVGVQLISTREGIDATNKALGLILDGKAGRPIAESAIRAVAATIANLGVRGEQEIRQPAASRGGRPPQQPPQQPQGPYIVDTRQQPGAGP